MVTPRWVRALQGSRRRSARPATAFDRWQRMARCRWFLVTAWTLTSPVSPLGHYSQCHLFLMTRTDPSALFKIRPLPRLTTRASSSVECGVRGANAGVWEVTLTGTTNDGVAFKFTTPVTVLPVTDVKQRGGTKKAYYFQPKSAAFIPTGKRKLDRLAAQVPADAVEVIAEVTGVSVSMKNEKKNTKLAKKALLRDRGVSGEAVGCRTR